MACREHYQEDDKETLLITSVTIVNLVQRGLLVGSATRVNLVRRGLLIGSAMKQT